MTEHSGLSVFKECPGPTAPEPCACGPGKSPEPREKGLQ